MAPITRIVVPVDFGPASDAAVEQAVALASAFGAELTVLHVCEPAALAYPGGPFIPTDEVAIALERSARVRVDGLVRQLSARAPRVTGLVRQGSPWREINEVAREKGADLIALGTQGRRGLPRALLGSVAEKVVRTSPIPVLTVHTTAAS